jgi:peptide/nickel transport system substrate-binding protein
MFGRAKPLAGLTPPSAVTPLGRLVPYPHDPARAAALWRRAGVASGRALRIAAPEKLERVALRVAADLQAALGWRRRPGRDRGTC